MPTYLVFEPEGGARTQANAERVVFLREKFSFWAFALTPFWLLRYRLWLAFLVWFVAFAAISIIGNKLGFGPYASLAASFFPSLLFGLEAVNLRGRKLLRSGYRDAGAVIAENIDAAEHRFFEDWKIGRAKSSATPIYPATNDPGASVEQNVIGMFPAPGQR